MLQNLQQTIQKITEFDFMAEQETIIADNPEAIADLQAQQLFSGIDSEGASIQLDGDGYAESTIKHKIKMGQVTDRVTWRDTGDLYKSLTAKISGGQFTVVSNGEENKYNSMIERSGEQVIGLYYDYRLEFAENVLMPNFKNVLLNKTGLVINV